MLVQSICYTALASNTCGSGTNLPLLGLLAPDATQEELGCLDIPGLLHVVVWVFLWVLGYQTVKLLLYASIKA